MQDFYKKARNHHRLNQYEEALELYQKGISCGDEKCWYGYAICLKNGYGIEKIYDKFIGLLNRRLNNANKRLIISENAKIKIIEEGYDEEFGARPLKRYIQKNIESLIAKDLLINPSKECIVIEFLNGEYVVR